MSVFAFQVTKVLESIPNAPGKAVTIRKLAPRHLDAAAKESQRKSIAQMKEIGISFIKEMRSLSDEDIKKATTSDPLLTYDVPTLIEKGVTEWTFSLELSPEHILELDEEVQDYLAREILKLSRPKLFTTKDEQEAEQKNVSSGSTAH